MQAAPPVPPLNSWGTFAVILVITTYLTYLSHRLYIQRFSEKERLAAELNLISEKVPVMLASVDSKGLYSFVNRRYADFFSKMHQDIIGKPVAEILDAYSYAQLQVALSLHQRQFRSRRLGPNGEDIHWIEADIMPDTTRMVPPPVTTPFCATSPTRFVPRSAWITWRTTMP